MLQAVAASPTSPVRVLSVVHYPHMGGPQGRNLKLARYFASTGQADWTVLLPDDRGPATQILSDAGVIAKTCRLGRLRASKDPRIHLKTISNWPGDVQRIVRAIRESRAEVVVLNGLINAQAALAARLSGVPLVWQILDTRTPRPLVRVLIPFVRRWADAVMVTGHRVAEHHFGVGHNLNGRLVTFFPPVDLEEFRPDPSRTWQAKQELRLGEGPVVGALANLTPQKGHLAFLRAARILSQTHPNVRFLWLGQAFPGQETYVAGLRKHAVEFGLELGRDLVICDPGTRSGVLAAAMDVAWMTSEPASEGIPTACEEVMALEKPVVAFSVGGLPDLIQDRVNGRLVPSQDVAQMASVTSALLEDPRICAEIGRAGRRRVVQVCSTTACAEVHLMAIRRALEWRETCHGHH